MPVRYLAPHERRLMESLWRHLNRDYHRPVPAGELERISGLAPEELLDAVRSLSREGSAPPPPAAGGARVPAEPRRPSERHDANQPYLKAAWARGLDGKEHLVEVRLTVDGRQYCYARD